MTRSARSRVSFAPLLCFLAIGAGLVACDGGGCDDCKCAEKPAEPAALPVVAESVAGADEAIGLLVRVNGAPITRDDVILSVAAKGRSTKIEPELEKNIAGTLAQRELEAQAARAAGLALDDATKGRLAALDAQRRVLEREALAAAWYRDEVRAKVTVTDEDAQRYYDGNKARIQSEVNVWQILERNQQKADAAAAEIAAGRPFEEVARAGFDKLPNGDAPWDLGFLKWKQVPKPWVATLDKLKPGEASGVITGPGGRFWVIKLVARRDNAAASFEATKAPILDLLRQEAIDKNRAEKSKALNAAAKIERFELPPMADPVEDHEE